MWKGMAIFIVINKAIDAAKTLTLAVRLVVILCLPIAT
jgi:hypothetical protein